MRKLPTDYSSLWLIPAANVNCFQVRVCSAIIATFVLVSFITIFTRVQSAPPSDFDHVSQSLAARVRGPPVVRAHAIHSCFAHALLDNLPQIVAASERSALAGRRWVLSFYRDDFDAFPSNLDLVDNATFRYRGVWGDLVDSLGASDVRFEHLKAENWTNRRTIDVSYNPQLSIWDHSDVYSSRSKLLSSEKRVPFERRACAYRALVRRVLEWSSRRDGRGSGSNSTAQILPPRRRSVLLVDREEGSRAYYPQILSGIVSVLEEQDELEFKGVRHLGNASLADQLEWVRSAEIMIARHGSAEAWGLFMTPGSVLFEVNSYDEFADNRSAMYDQVCRVSGCRHVNSNENYAVEELCALMNWTNLTSCASWDHGASWEDNDFLEDDDLIQEILS